jgi:hypothetical protein
MDEAYSRVYSDAKNRDLIERAIRTRGEVERIADERSPSTGRVSTLKPPV